MWRIFRKSSKQPRQQLRTSTTSQHRNGTKTAPPHEPSRPLRCPSPHYPHIEDRALTSTMAPHPTLHHVPRCISSPLVQIILELEQLAGTRFVHVHEMSFPELKQPEYLAINPMGTTPAFTDEGIIIWESGAILDHLLERYDTEARFYPAIVPSSANGTTTSPTVPLAQRAKYLHIKQFILVTFYPFVTGLFLHSLLQKKDQDKQYLQAAITKCRQVFLPLFRQWLGDDVQKQQQPYLLGDKISAVDFLVTKPFGNLHTMGILQDFPDLQALYERVSSRPSYKQAYEGMATQEKKRKGIPTALPSILV